MTRETRNNLLFLAIVIVLVSPGGVMLFRRMLRPGARPIGAADVVINTTAWMDPYASPGLERLAPAATVKWVEGVCAGEGFVMVSRAGSGATTAPAVLAYRKSPTVGSEIPFQDVALADATRLVRSETGYLQAVGYSRAGGVLRVMLWSEGNEVGVARVAIDGVMVELANQRQVAVPSEVRHDLQNVGFIDPPRKISVLDVPWNAGCRKVKVLFAQAGKTMHNDEVEVPPELLGGK